MKRRGRAGKKGRGRCGISVGSVGECTADVLRNWTLMVKRAETIPSSTDETLVPASRVHELERQIEDLKRQVGRQAMTLRVLEKQGIL
jgi:hypothetical protein